jgi:hypothetical protein
MGMMFKKVPFEQSLETIMYIQKTAITLKPGTPEYDRLIEESLVMMGWLPNEFDEKLQEHEKSVPKPAAN